jgi:hypothetical protein
MTLAELIGSGEGTTLASDVMSRTTTCAAPPSARWRAPTSWLSDVARAPVRAVSDPRDVAIAWPPTPGVGP